VTSVLVYGYGFIGKAFAEAVQSAGFDIAATARTAEKRQELDAQGISAVDPQDEAALSHAIRHADGILITPAPDDGGCPAYAAVGDLALDGKWLGYLSTTGVYGDRNGGWAFEDDVPTPSSTEGRRRMLAEQQWLAQGANIFRLPGLYGPGRNVVERLRDGTARRIHKPGHVFSRLHHDDCASALLASFERRSRDIFNLCDDEPASAEDVLIHAAKLTCLPLPPQIAWDDPSLSPATRRFYNDNKRVANARAKAVLGWRLQYPTYREGLQMIMETDNHPTTSG
jgi:nucleoside-diphosphate-sugar epimerase